MKSKVSTRAQIVDEFGEIERKMLLWRPPATPVNPYADRHAELEAEIRSWHDDLAGELGAVVRGKLYQVAVSARGFRSTVSAAAKRAAFSLIEGAGKLDPFEFFDITIADMKAHCGAEFVKANIPKLQVGPRTLSVVAAQPVTAKKVA
jgi:hypothetical protein